MNWIITQSSTIRKFKYNPNSQILTIVFTSGEKYNYYNVPINIFEEFKITISKGQFFNKIIRNHFICNKNQCYYLKKM